ncbi:MAG TPA: hypothetical protein VF729_01295, partial [Solirubrobacterales bacterium]
SLVYARVLNGVLADLERRWKDGGQALESAGTSAAQSTAAANLRAAFATASGRLRKTNVTPQSAAGNEAVADAFDRLGIAYGRLAAAAAAGSTSAYDEARAAVEEGKAGVRHTLRDLRSLGYRT